MIDLSTVEEIYAPANPRGLIRTVTLARNGIFRLARRDAELYSVMVAAAGAWGRAKVMNGRGEPKWMQPSTFTGSFVLNGGCEEGLLVELYGSGNTAPNLTVQWREPDARVV